LGIYYGVLIVMMPYNLFLFFSVRDVSYFYYIFYVVFVSLYQAGIDGLAFQFLWPRSPEIELRSVLFFVCFGFIGIFQFVKSFLELKRNMPGINKFLTVVVWALGLIAVGIFFFEYKIANIIVSLLGLLAPLLIFAIGLKSFIQGFRPARFFLLAWTMFLLLTSMSALRIFAILPVNFITIHGMRIGSILEVILLSLALADRINIYKKEKIMAQKQALEEAESANIAKNEFLSNMSHEIRTPLHQILSFSQFGISKIHQVEPEKLLHYFSKIKGVGTQLMSLLDVILDLSKLESGKMDYEMSLNDLNKIIRDVATEFYSLKIGKGVKIDIAENNNPALSICDKFKISQVIRNFLSNAIKFAPGDKKITISIGQQKTDDDTTLAFHVSVKDEGIGIPVDELESIFDKFTQSSKTNTGAGGKGLGLAICKEIIKAHNGKIWAENNLEGGATFSFMLPYEQEVK
jgi:two-component system, sensor histidine kinase LadS